MNSYRNVIDYIEVWSIWSNKTRFIPSSGCINATLWMHHMDTWTLTKRIERRLVKNCTIILRAILIKSWKQHPTKQQLYYHLPTISKTIQQDMRYTGKQGQTHEKRSSWTFLHVRASVGRTARTYQQQICADSGCCLEDLPGAVDNRDG